MGNQPEDNLKRLIDGILKRGQTPLMVCVGTVSNIDEDKRICDVAIDDELKLSNCRLNAIIDSYDNRLLVVPKDQSKVAFVTIGGKYTELLILAYSEIEKVLLTIGDSDIVIQDGSIQMNGGDLGGLIKIEDLTDKLNGLVSEVNALKENFNTHTHLVTTTAPAGEWTSKTTTKIASDASRFNKSDYEDSKITH